MSHSTPLPLFSLRCGNGEVTAISFLKCLDNDGTELVTGHSTGDIQIWNSETNRARVVWSAHGKERIRWVGTANGKVFSYGRDNKLHMWSVSSGIAKIQGSMDVDCDTHCPCDVIATESTILVAVPHNSESVRVVNASDFSNVATFLASGKDVPKCGMVMFVKFVQLKAGPLLLMVAFENGSIATFRVTSENKSVVSNLSVHQDLMTCFDFDVDSMRGISGSADANLVTWKMDRSDFSLTVFKRVAITNPGVQCIAIHPFGLYVAVGGWDSRIRIFSWKTLKPLAVLDFHSATVNSLAFCRRGESVVHLAAGSKDGRVSVWNLYSQPLK